MKKFICIEVKHVGKKVLVNAYFAINLGDDLFLKVLFDRYPNVQWYLLTESQEYNNMFKEYRNVKTLKMLNLKVWNRSYNLFYKINKLLKYKKYDAFVNIGGSIFMEFPGWKRGLKSRAYLPNKFKETGKKTFILGANFGPYENDEFVDKHKVFFSKFDDICFRDSYSFSLFKDFSQVRAAPDIVFNLKVIEHLKKQKSVGFSIINLKNREGLKKYYSQYNEKIIEFIERYIELGSKIKLFSFCSKEGDLEIAHYIKNQIKSSYRTDIEIINYEGKIENFLGQFQSCETIIGTRFHSIILGLLFNQSVFPIIYSDKTLNVLQDLKMDENYSLIKGMNKLDINYVIEHIKNNKLQDKGVFARAERQFQKLDLLLN